MSKLNLNNIFSTLPVFLSLDINYSDSDLNNDAYIYANNIIDKINNATNYTANILCNFNCSGKISDMKFYINGKEFIKHPSILKYMSDLTYDVYKDTLFNLEV